MLKKTLSIVLMLAIALMAMVGCGSTATTAATTAATTKAATAVTTASGASQAATTAAGKDFKTSGKPIRVAVQSFYASYPVSLIVERGWDKEAGIPFQLIVFNGGAPINEAMAANQWDIAVTGGAFIYALAKFDGKLIAHQINGTGGNSIVARKGDPIFGTKGFNKSTPEVYGTPDILKGKTVLQNPGTTSQYIMQAWLNNLGVKPSEVKSVAMDFMQIIQSFKANQGDYASISLAAEEANFEKNGWQKVATLSSLNTPLYEATVCTSDMYKTRYADVVKFAELLYKANDELLKDPALQRKMTKKWYADNGKTMTDEQIELEVSFRPIIGSAEAKKIDPYKFAVTYGDFYIGNGLIEPAKAEVIKANIAADVFKDSLRNY